MMEERACHYVFTLYRFVSYILYESYIVCLLFLLVTLVGYDLSYVITKPA